MKKKFLFLLLGMFLLFSCEDDDEMKYAKIYFPLATRAHIDSTFVFTFDFSRDTTHIVRAYCAGTILPSNDIDVKIKVDKDSLLRKQAKNQHYEKFVFLPENSYTVQPSDMNLKITKGKDGADLIIAFDNSKLDPSTKYILPLKIEQSSHYEISEQYGALFIEIRAMTEKEKVTWDQR